MSVNAGPQPSMVCHVKFVEHLGAVEGDGGDCVFPFSRRMFSKVISLEVSYSLFRHGFFGSECVKPLPVFLRNQPAITSRFNSGATQNRFYRFS